VAEVAEVAEVNILPVNQMQEPRATMVPPWVVTDKVVVAETAPEVVVAEVAKMVVQVVAYSVGITAVIPEKTVPV
jgi:hypothetical protein